MSRSIRITNKKKSNEYARGGRLPEKALHYVRIYCDFLKEVLTSFEVTA